MCSSTHTSLLVLLPSTWWAAVAAPQRNPFGNAPGAVPGAASAAARPVCPDVIASPAAASPVERNVLLVNSPTVRVSIGTPQSHDPSPSLHEHSPMPEVDPVAGASRPV